jgi:hypothetical protein
VELKEALKEIAQKGVEMERIKAVIERDRRKLLSSAETSVTDVLTDAIVAGTCWPRLSMAWGRLIAIVFREFGRLPVRQQGWKGSRPNL